MHLMPSTCQTRAGDPFSSEKLPAAAAYWPLDDVSQQHGSPSQEDAVATEVESAQRQRLRARDRTRRECSSTCRPGRRCPTCDGSDRMFFPLRTWIRYRCDILLPLLMAMTTAPAPGWSRASAASRDVLARCAPRQKAMLRGDMARPPVRQRSASASAGLLLSATGGVAKRGR